METRQCCICGCEYIPRQKNQVTCGDIDCRRIQHLEYMREYGRKHRKEHREYNREWMARRRAEQKAEEETKKTSQGFIGDGYAERQKARTLAMVGGIEL